MKSLRGASVVPLRRFPPHLSEFTYSIPAHLDGRVTAGSIVRVPFKQSVITGVVVATQNTAPQEGIKDIQSVLPLSVTATQLQIAHYLADTYVQSLGVVFNSMLADPPVHGESKSVRHVGTPLSVPHSADRESPRESEYLLYEQSSDMHIYLAEQLRRWQSHGQTLLIAPERFQRDELVAVACKAGIAGAVQVPDKRRRSEFVDVWQQSGSAKVVVGGMLALLLPFQQLRRIVLVEAEHQLFQKAEQNPRYHLADFIWKVAALYDAKVTVSGFSPDIRLMHQVSQKKYPVRKIIHKRNFIVSVIDMEHERESGNYEWLSDATRNAVENSSGRILVYYNRHGYARRTVCTDCGFTVRCDRCDRPLILEESKKILLCTNCGFKRDVYLQCPRCKSTAIHAKGSGIERIVSDLKKQFPSKSIAALSRRSRDTDQQRSESDILVATASILSQRSLKFKVGIMVNADFDLHVPNYHAAESLRHTIGILHSMVNALFIQTFDASHYVFTTLHAVDEFYREELAWRKKLSYPPYATILKLWVREKDPQRFEKQRNELIRYFAPVRPAGPLEHRDGSASVATLICKLKPGDSQALDLLRSSTYTWMHAEINPYHLL